MKNEERIVYTDILRIIALFAVILLHVAQHKWHEAPVHSFDWQIFNLYNAFVRWAVPVFVMISGIFMLAPSDTIDDYKEYYEKSYKRILKKNIFRIFCAIVFWGLIYNLFFYACGFIFKHKMFSVNDLLSIPVKIIFGPPWYHLWFLYMLCGLYILTPLIRVFVKNCRKEGLEIFIIMFFIFGNCMPLFNYILPLLTKMSALQFYFPLSEMSGFLGYYIAGYYFANYEINKRTRIWLYISALFSIAFTMIGTSLISCNKNKPEEFLYGSLLPNALFVAFSIFILAKRHFSIFQFSEKTKRKISFIGKCTFGMYLVHDLFLQIFWMLGFHTLLFNPLFCVPVIAILVMILSFFVSVVINKIPFLNKYIA